jgi:hypothetical protein
MDTSKEYIKMCDYFEIQDCRIMRDRFDFVVRRLSNCDDYIRNISDFNSVDTIWLPRQDQLQEMLDHTLRATHKLFSRFVLDDYFKPTLRESEKGSPFAYFSSMEQLWLAFVMEECYNKRWTGNEWKGVDKK